MRKEEIYTMEDIYALSDGERAELIDGKIYYMSPSGRMHQKISWKLHQTIANYIDSKIGKVPLEPFGSFFSKKRIDENRRF